MSTAIRKMFLVGVLALACLTFSFGSAHATLYTIDSEANAGLASNATPFTTLTGRDSSGAWHTYSNIGAISDYTAAMNALSAYNITQDWLFTSAGNGASGSYIRMELWFAPGTYRVTAVSGGFTYDSWGWSTDPADRSYRWLLQVMEGDGGSYSSYVLGDGTLYGSAADAGSAKAGIYRDFTLTNVGSLGFWIWDDNTMDNLGTLTFDVSSVPLPPSLLLLFGGLVFVLVPRLRARFNG